MKFNYTLLAAALLAATGCTKPAHVTFNGNVAGLTDATFFLKDAADSTIVAENINNGAIKVDAQLDSPGYGTLSINKNGSKEPNNFEVYLESGAYTVKADAARLDHYPKITSSSSIQKELSAYYEIYEQVVATSHENRLKAEALLNSKKATTLTKNEYIALIDKVNAAQDAEEEAKINAFKNFVSKNPQSVAAAHLMSKLEVDVDPVAYNDIYQKLSAAAKNTDDGKELGAKLQRLVKLVPGAEAPSIAGNTPDGKPFSKAGLNKKGYIIDFWRAANQVSRVNHQDMINVLQKDKNARQFGIISVSLDSKRDWWTKAITDDNMTWPQYADLKGDESENAKNWMITTIPSYYLVDSQWHIIERNVDYNRLLFTIDSYVKKH